MIADEYNDFCALWASAHEIQAGGKVFSDNARSMIFEALGRYPLFVVKKAITKHCQQSKFAPTIADIVEIISDRDGSRHLGADEAWAIALRSLDETLPIVLTQEIITAKAMVQSIWDSGDKVGTRMAFRETYNRLLVTAAMPVWFVTQGDDKSLTISVVDEAIRLGRLPALDKKGKSTADQYRIEAPTTSTQKLIATYQEKTGNVINLEKWGAIKNSLADTSFSDGIIERENERRNFEGHRQSVVDKADRVLAGVMS